MNVEDDIRLLTVPAELDEFIGEYYKALKKRAAEDLLGESEYRCFKRFLKMYGSGKYKFAFKAMRRLFSFLNLLMYVDENGKAAHLNLYPVQKFMLCGIFGLRYPDGRYVTNTANLYEARRNGKSFVLSAVLHYLMGMSKFRNELIILASCKGQNATICFNVGFSEAGELVANGMPAARYRLFSHEITCVEVLAKNIAQTRWGLYGSDHNEVANTMQLFRKAMNLQPYPGINAYDFWNYMEKQRQGGNAYAYLKYDSAGILENIVPLDNANMKVYWDTANILEGKRKIIYEYNDQVTGQNFVFLPEEILHFKAYSVNGIVGRPAINVLWDTLKADAEVEGALRSGVNNGFDGTIVLSYTSDLSESKQRDLQNRVKELLKNSNSTILPLPAGMTATNIKNDVKSYFDALKTYDAQAISSFFGIPLAMLNIGGGAGMATFSTNQLMSFYSGTIAPIIAQYANELTVKLLTQRQAAKGYRFDTANDVFDMLNAQATSDSIPAMLSNGEYVLRSSAVDRIGVGVLDAMNAGAVPQLAGGSDESALAVSGGNTVILNLSALDPASFREFLSAGGLAEVKQALFEDNRQFAAESGVW